MTRHPQAAWSLPEGASEVVLVRHGSSMAGAPGVVHELIDGHLDPPLAPAGHEQAAALGQRLAAQRVDAIFVSSLQRTAQTAAPLAQAHGLEPIVRHDLREVFLGELEQEFATLSAAGDPRIRQVTREQRWDVLPGAESMESFGARIAVELEAVADHVGPGGVAVAVVHAGVVAEACRQATGSEALAFRAVENGSITRVVRTRGGRWTLRSFNDIAHLDAT
jgi:probable phosphoglycerate mutase